MTETEDSLLNQYRLEFRLFGIEIAFEPEAVEYVAGVAENRKTGARALVSVWENILTDFQFELPGSSFTKLAVTCRLCAKPTDVLLKMIERSPFADFVENFRREYGIELILDEAVQEWLSGYAAEKKIQLSEAIKKRLSGASALNYMGIPEPYTVTREMVEGERWFDKLFASWYDERKKKNRTP